MSRWLISGGTGSLGRALTRTILARYQHDTIVVYSRSELLQAQMATEFGAESDLNGGRLRFVLGDVRDPDRLKQAMGGVDYVIHAAALKRVDAIAYNPTEAKRTNIDGTENVCRAAIEAGVQRLITVSSDKGALPENSYGVTKRMAEFITIASNIYAVASGTKLACVRYGNVLGSRGSVVGIWRQQAKDGVPITMTDSHMTRFWMTLTQACDFVLWALMEQRGGEIFVPDLPALQIGALATAIAGPGYPVTITGLRPGGEKVAEMLVSDEEITRTLRHAPHFYIKPSVAPWTSEPWPGTPVDTLWRFHSGLARRLSVEDLQAALKEIP